MEVSTLLNILIGIIVTGLGWWNTTQHNQIETLKINLNDVKVNYAHKNDLNEHKTDLKEWRNELNNRFDRMENLINSALGHK